MWGQSYLLWQYLEFKHSQVLEVKVLQYDCKAPLVGALGELEELVLVRPESLGKPEDVLECSLTMEFFVSLDCMGF